MFLGCIFFNNSGFIDPRLLDNLIQKKFDTGYLLFDQKKSLFNYQLFVVKTKVNTIEVLNPLDSKFPVGFSSLEALNIYLRQIDYSFKLSVILYDEEKNDICLIRDLFGVKPLFYLHVPNQFIAFSSSLTALIRLDVAKPYLGINTTRVHKYLEWLSDGDLYSSDTIYSKIQNVLPGNSLLIKSDQVISSKFLLFNPPKRDSQTTKEEFGEEFKSLFFNSIKTSLRNSNIVAATLSGGLDSSSICCMVKRIEPDISIHTIYADTNTILTQEGSYAKEVADHINSHHHSITPSLDNLFESAVLHTSLYGHPEYMLNGSSLNRSVIETALNSQCSELFSGHAGDSIVGYGGDYIFRLFDEGKWHALRDIISAPIHQSLRYDDGKTENDLTKDLLFALLLRKKELLNAFELTLLVTRMSIFFKIPLRFFFEKGMSKINNYFHLPSSITLGLPINNSHLDTHYQFPLQPDLIDVYSNQYDSAFGIQSVLINEQFYILDNHYRVHHKFPFYDKSLFELCLAVPSEIKYDNGLRRGHFREAMKGILPENVRTRVSKANFGFYGRITTLKLYEQSRDMLDEHNQVWDFVEKHKFDQCVKLLIQNNLPVYSYNKVNYFVSKTIYLAIWLDLLKNDGFISDF